jgi:glycyl-tRNA synthetase beta chain
MEYCDFLFEIGTEELPAKALKKLMLSLQQQVESAVTAKQLEFNKSSVYATSRRLAIIIYNLQTHQNDQAIEKKGPRIEVAFDAQGNPSKAALGFASSLGVEVNDLHQVSDKKSTNLAYKQLCPGLSIAEIMPEIIKNALNGLPMDKKMRWGSYNYEFIRPVKWLVMMADTQILDCKILGLKADRYTYGHRVHSPKKLILEQVYDYTKALRNNGYIEPCFHKRQNTIRSEIKQQADNLSANISIDENLLEEVTAMVEWPVAFSGSFNPKYLDIPVEVLVSTMQEHQKYFHLYNNENKLVPNFIGVANINSKLPQVVISGNEKVITPRFDDALFCFEIDKRHTQLERRAKLAEVLFNRELGSLLDNNERITKLADFIADISSANQDTVHRAAMLCKSDLVSQMVLEFPHLQGIMGGYYAAHDGEPATVCKAISEVYLPSFANDKIPETIEGSIISLANKFDSLVGLFIINQPPTGSKDPFALRRACIGIIRIIIENKLNLNLTAILEFAINIYQQQGVVFKLESEQALVQAKKYLLTRVESYYEEQDIINVNKYSIKNIIASVMVVEENNLYNMNLRIKDIIHILNKQTTELDYLIEANKRIKNILAKADVAKLSSSINKSIAVETAEISLINYIEDTTKEFEIAIKNNNYLDAMDALIMSCSAINDFFDNVMVNSDDPIIKVNRLTILYKLRQRFLSIADLAVLC